MNKIYPSKFKDWKKIDRELKWASRIAKFLWVVAGLIVITWFI